MNHYPFKISFIITFLLVSGAMVWAQDKAEVRQVDGLPTLFINEKPYPPFAYMSYLGEEEYYREIATTGTHLYCFPAYLGDRGINTNSGIGPFRSPVWTGNDRYDFSSITEDFEKIIRSDAKAKVIIRFHLDPPLWWEKMNPDASTHLADGSTFRQSFFSDKWRAQTGKALRDCITWLLDSPYSSHLIGIHVAAGETEEWFYHPPQYNDNNPERIHAFREWLKATYDNNNAALQNAWNDNRVTFTNAQPANILENTSNRWRIPGEEENIIDTHRFQAETLVDNITFFCKVVKDVSNGELLTGVFSGYHYFVTNPKRGHGALAKLLESDYLDYISSPNTYNRVVGEDWPPMAAIQSVQLHGKLWLAENDTRTSLTTLLKEKAPRIAPDGHYEGGVWIGPKEMDTSESLLLKNAGRMLAEGYGGWWFDMWGGWFSHPRLLNIIKLTNELYTSALKDKAIETKAEVCVMADEELCFWDASHGSLTEQILSNRSSLAKTGAPYDLFLRSDINKIPEDQYKIIWLKGFLQLNDNEKKRIEEWTEEGKTILWTNDKGTTILKNNSTRYMEGVRFITDAQLRAIFSDAGVHIYIDSGEVLYVGMGWICVHSAEGGKKRITLPFVGNITDPVNNETFLHSTDAFDIEMEPASTVLLRVSSARD